MKTSPSPTRDNDSTDVCPDHWAVVRIDPDRLGGGRLDDHPEGRVVAYGFPSEESARAEIENWSTGGEYLVTQDFER